MMRLKKKPTTFMRQQNEDEVGPSYNPSEIEDLVKEIKSWQQKSETVDQTSKLSNSGGNSRRGTQPQ